MNEEPKERTFPVIEVFGPTIQGEGALAGVPSHFIRFGGCDYRCSWCDSGHAVLPGLVKIYANMMTTKNMMSRVRGLKGKPEWVTFSGGNPALLELGELLGMLHDERFRVAIETQGTMAKPWMTQLDLVTVSPKGPSSGNVTTARVLDTFLERLGGPPLSPLTVLKVVVFNDEDYAFAKVVHKTYPTFQFFLSIGTYSGGLTGEWRLPDGGLESAESLSARYRNWAEQVAEDKDMGDVIVLPQLHYLMWGSEKGR